MGALALSNQTALISQRLMRAGAMLPQQRKQARQGRGSFFATARKLSLTMIASQNITVFIPKVH